MRLIYIADRGRPYDALMGAINPDPGATIVRESRGLISALFGFLALCCTAALARGVPGAHTTAGRLAAAVIFGGLLVVILAGWAAALRRPRRLEITQDAIRYVQRDGRATSLSRQYGDHLRWVKQLRGRTWRLGLTIVGTDDVMILGTFSRKTVQRACLARGWHFDERTVVQR